MKTVSKKATAEAILSASESYLKAWNDNDFDLMQSLSVNDIVRNANGEITSHNQNEIRETMEFWHTAIPDFKIWANHIVVDRNKSFISWTSKGTNSGMFGDASPTHKSSVTEGFTVLTFNKEGKIVHEQAYYDLLNVVQSWGYTVKHPSE